MSGLFHEAIAEAKQLRRLAEENAKTKIVDAMTPKIRKLIEQELVDDLDDEYEETSSIEDIISPEGQYEENETLDIDALIPSLAEPSPSSVTINVDGGADFDLSVGDVDIEEEEDEDLIMSLNQESAHALAKLIRRHKNISPDKHFHRHAKILERKIKGFDRLLNYVDIRNVNPTLRETARKYYTRLLKEMITLRRSAILTEEAENKNQARLKYNRLIKEMKNMSRRHVKTLFDRLFENKYEGEDPETEELDELDMVFSAEDLETLGVEETGDVDVSGLDVSVSSEEVGGEEEVEGEEEEIDLEELDLVLSDEDLDVLGVEEPETVDVSGLDVTVSSAPAEEEVETEEETEEVLEIDEGMLRREIRRMRRIREQDEAVDADPYLDHGGVEVGDVVLDVDEEDLINVLADELGAETGNPAPTVESRRRRRRAPRRQARRRNQRKVTEGRRNRALSNKLVEYKQAVGSLRNQLVEMNLFNAKLLYVNKLMQNRNLTSKQQKAIVEALDNAKTLREAKLLYKSLTSSLNRHRKSGRLAEGRVVRTLGSSSRSTRSAAPARNGVEVDRWAVLAGINKDK